MKRSVVGMSKKYQPLKEKELTPEPLYNSTLLAETIFPRKQRFSYDEKWAFLTKVIAESSDPETTG